MMITINILKPLSELQVTCHPKLFTNVTIFNLLHIIYLQPLFMLQKRDIREIHNAAFWRQTNSIFITSKLPNLHYVVQLQSAIFTNKAKNNLFHNIKLSCTQQREMFPISVARIKLWISLNTNLKSCSYLNHFIHKRNSLFKKIQRGRSLTSSLSSVLFCPLLLLSSLFLFILPL